MLEIWVKDTESVALDKSMVGISALVVQFKTCLVLELTFELSQADKLAAARTTRGP